MVKILGPVYRDLDYTILKELKYATPLISTFTYVFDVWIKSFYEMTY